MFGRISAEHTVAQLLAGFACGIVYQSSPRMETLLKCVVLVGGIAGYCINRDFDQVREVWGEYPWKRIVCRLAVPALAAFVGLIESRQFFNPPCIHK